MKNVKFIFIALTVAFFAASCGGGNSVDGALSQLEKSMQKVEKNKTSMTGADWEAFAKETEASCKILNEALESKDVSTLKKIKISAVVLKYTAVLGEAAMHTAIDSLNVKMQESGVADSLSSVTDQLKDALQSEEAQKTLQDLQKALGK
jgi:hypothetical protein